MGISNFDYSRERRVVALASLYRLQSGHKRSSIEIDWI